MQKLTANQVSNLFLAASIEKGNYPMLRYGQAFWNVFYDHHKDIASWAMDNTEHHKLYQSDDKDFVTDFVMANLVDFDYV